MKTNRIIDTKLITLAIAGLIASSAAMACEDSAQRDSRADVQRMHVAAAVRTPTQEAAAPAIQTSAKTRLPTVQTQEQPDPRYLPYVSNGWYGN
jgi:hypothetical protein